MIYRCVAALLCLLSAGSAVAQLRVELEFEQETFLPREPLYAVVRIYNTSGRTLVLGKDNQWLSFTVENVDGTIVKDKKPPEVEGEFTLPSPARATKMVNLEEAYDLAKFGRYMVRANLQIPEWQENFSSKAVPVGIATGVKLWETPFGVPSDDKTGRPEIRRFQLLSANHLKQLSLYVRITGENESETVSLFPLGGLHGFSKPEPQMDRWSNLHVLYQDTARGYRYSMITPDGLLLARESWEVVEDSRPSLRLKEDGRIVVAGGVRRVSPTDLPPPDLLSDSTDTPPETPAADKPLDAKPPAK